MKIWNFGSLNIDDVYRVDSFPRPGETRPCLDYSVFCGGKGLNQSIAAAKAGSLVCHVGVIGEDGEMLAAALERNGVETGLIRRAAGRSGRAVIQVDARGQNCILLYGGANRRLTEEYVDEALAQAAADDMVLLQNETNLVGEIIDKAWRRGLRVALNAAPMDSAVASYDLRKLSWLIVNEIEGAEITGRDSEKPLDIIDSLAASYPGVGLLLTLGRRGVCCHGHGRRLALGIYEAPAADTTAAGDAFTGYFLYGILRGLPLERTLDQAAMASALCVARKGASDSIPARDEVESALAGKIFGELTKGAAISLV
ncbi:MAG: ribokinase [Candidatus Adiutrix sp.]|jgi:ribokinase|nr:ribokinase [Candidatus Adiutrix sp.]